MDAGFSSNQNLYQPLEGTLHRHQMDSPPQVSEGSFACAVAYLGSPLTEPLAPNTWMASSRSSFCGVLPTLGLEDTEID